MRLSSLQKYILLQCYFNKDKKYSKKDLSKFYFQASEGGAKTKFLPSRASAEKTALGLYNKNQKKPKNFKKIITKSIERLIIKELMIGYGEHTPHKWYVKEIKLTPKGRRVAKKLRGEQQELPLK